MDRNGDIAGAIAVSVTLFDSRDGVATIGIPELGPEGEIPIAAVALGGNTIARPSRAAAIQAEPQGGWPVERV